MLLGSLAQGTRFGLLSLDRAASVAGSTQELESTERVLRRLIAAMAQGGEGGPPPLQGKAGTMAFNTDRPIALGLDAAHRLVLREIENGLARETTLLTGVEKLEIAYWRSAWQSRWQSDGLPGLVRIRIVFPPGGTRHWPDIVIAPRREATPS